MFLSKYIALIGCVAAACAQQIDYNTQIRNKPVIFQPALYNFVAQTPGVPLTATVPVAITMIPCPLGVATTGQSMYVSGGTGTAEPVTISSLTCTSGAPIGTVTFTPSNNHSGAWTISSASAGIQESTNAACAAGASLVHLTAGTYLTYAEVRVACGLKFSGDGQAATSITPQTAGQSVFHFVSANSASMEHFSISYGTLQVAGKTVNLDGTFKTYINDVNFFNGWDEIFMTDSSEDTILGCTFGAFGDLAILIFSSTADANGPRIGYNIFTSPTTAKAAIKHLSSGGVTVFANGFHNESLYGYWDAATGSSSQLQFTGNICDGQQSACLFINPSVTWTGYNIVGNFMSNFLTFAYVCIFVNSTNAQFGIVTGNFCSASTNGATAGTAGMILNGTNWFASSNTIQNANTALQTNAGVNITLGPHQISSSPTAVVLGSTGVQMLVPLPLTFAQMTAFAMNNSSIVYCTDCNSTCSAGASSGRTCFRENAAWTH